MKKYLLFLSCSVFAANAALALTASNQLQAMKELVIKEFEKIDTNKDGVLDKDEYLSYQFESLRSNIIDADGFDTLKVEVEKEPAVSDSPKVSAELGGVSPALKEMADFDLDFDLDDPFFGKTDDKAEATPKKLTMEDVMPKIESSETETMVDKEAPAEETAPEIDLSISEEASLKGILADMVQKENPELNQEKTKTDPKAKEQQINFMLETIKKTLPKKIDDITTWTGIEYENGIISYLYQADIDTTPFSAAEKSALQKSIETDACTKAYTEMCPKIKPMFIDEGINMKISYLDKKSNEIGFCDFNKETCKQPTPAAEEEKEEE